MRGRLLPSIVLAIVAFAAAGCADSPSKHQDPDVVPPMVVTQTTSATTGVAAPPPGPHLLCQEPCVRPMGAAGAEPWLAVDTADPMHAVAMAMAQSQGDVTHPWALVSVTRDGGASWEHAMPPGALSDGGTYTFFADPMVAFAQGSVVLAGLVSESPSFLCAQVACQVMPAYARSLDLAVWTSSDGGATWSDPAVVADSVAGYVRAPEATLPVTEYHDREQIVVDPVTGDVHLFWSGLRGDGRDVLHSRSGDGGATWSAPVAILPDLYGVSAAARAGHIVLTMKDVAADTFVLVESRDDGATWSQAHVLGDMPSPYWQPAPPAILPAGEVLVARPAGEAGLVLERWTGNGTEPVWNWTGQPTFKRDAGIAVDAQGRGILAFYDGDANALMVAPLAGAQVGEPARIGNTTTDAWLVFEYLGTACAAGVCHVVWPATEPEYGLWSATLTWTAP